MSMLDALAQRSPRERMLVAVLLGGIAPLAIAFGVLLPLHEMRNAAEARLSEAQTLNMWIADRASEAAALTPGTTTSADGQYAPIGLSAIEQSLMSAGLRPAVSRLEASASGGIVMEFAPVAFVNVMQWLDARDPDWGYVITSARIEQGGGPSLVNVAITLAPNQ